MDLLQLRLFSRQPYPAVLTYCLTTVRQDHVHAGPGVHLPAAANIGDVTVHFLPGLEAAMLTTEKAGTTLQEPAA